MLAYIKGKVLTATEHYAIIETGGGVGYKVFVKPQTAEVMKGGETVALYTHQYVREDAVELYGFATADELAMFDQLISVSGVGPKSGLGILGVASVERLAQAIAAKDHSLLTKVSGVGKKTAERIVLDLADKFAARGSAASTNGGGVGDELMDALSKLGYKPLELREISRQIPPEAGTLAQRLKQALKLLGS